MTFFNDVKLLDQNKEIVVATEGVLPSLDGSRLTNLSVTGGAVESVNGKTGTVVLSKSDLGLGNVNNTSDADKPISTATQAALDEKASTAPATQTAAGLMSSSDKKRLDEMDPSGSGMTDEERERLLPVPTGADKVLVSKGGGTGVSYNDDNTVYLIDAKNGSTVNKAKGSIAGLVVTPTGFSNASNGAFSVADGGSTYINFNNTSELFKLGKEFTIDIYLKATEFTSTSRKDRLIIRDASSSRVYLSNYQTDDASKYGCWIYNIHMPAKVMVNNEKELLSLDVWYADTQRMYGIYVNGTLVSTGTLDNNRLVDIVSIFGPDYSDPSVSGAYLYYLRVSKVARYKGVSFVSPEDAGYPDAPDYTWQETDSTLTDEERARLLPDDAAEGDMAICREGVDRGNGANTRLLVQPIDAAGSIVDTASGNAAPVGLVNYDVTVDENGDMVFNGTGAYIDIGSNKLPDTVLDTGKEWTLDIVFYATTQKTSCLLGYGEKPRLDFLLDNSGGLSIGGGPNFGAGWSYNTWHLFTFELYLDGADWKWTGFRNGAVVASGTWTTAAWRAAPLAIGGDLSDYPYRNFEGKMRVVRIQQGATHRGHAFTPLALPWLTPTKAWNKIDVADIAITDEERTRLLPEDMSDGDMAITREGLDRGNSAACKLLLQPSESDGEIRNIALGNNEPVSMVHNSLEVIDGELMRFSQKDNDKHNAVIAANSLPEDVFVLDHEWVLDLVVNVTEQAESGGYLFGYVWGSLVFLIQYHSGKYMFNWVDSQRPIAEYHTVMNRWVHLTWEHWHNGTEWVFSLYANGTLLATVPVTFSDTSPRERSIGLGVKGETITSKSNTREGFFKAVRIQNNAPHKGVSFTPQPLPWVASTKAVTSINIQDVGRGPLILKCDATEQKVHLLLEGASTDDFADAAVLLDTFFDGVEHVKKWDATTGTWVALPSTGAIPGDRLKVDGAMIPIGMRYIRYEWRHTQVDIYRSGLLSLAYRDIGGWGPGWYSAGDNWLLGEGYVLLHSSTTRQWALRQRVKTTDEGGEETIVDVELATGSASETADKTVWTLTENGTNIMGFTIDSSSVEYASGWTGGAYPATESGWTIGGGLYPDRNPVAQIPVLDATLGICHYLDSTFTEISFAYPVWHLVEIRALVRSANSAITGTVSLTPYVDDVALDPVTIDVGADWGAVTIPLVVGTGSVRLVRTGGTLADGDWVTAAFRGITAMVAL